MFRISLRRTISKTAALKFHCTSYFEAILDSTELYRVNAERSVSPPVTGKGLEMVHFDAINQTHIPPDFRIFPFGICIFLFGPSFLVQLHG